MRYFKVRLTEAVDVVVPDDVDPATLMGKRKLVQAALEKFSSCLAKYEYPEIMTEEDFPYSGECVVCGLPLSSLRLDACRDMGIDPLCLTCSPLGK